MHVLYNHIVFLLSNCSKYFYGSGGFAGPVNEEGKGVKKEGIRNEVEQKTHLIATPTQLKTV